VKRHRNIVDCGLEFRCDVEESSSGVCKGKVHRLATDPLGVVLENNRLRDSILAGL
jgi:hypothetical protein